MGKKKKDGQIFTPKETVNRMLDDVLGWTNLKYEKGRVYWPNVRKHIIDNSCGDGAFLAHIVDFYIHNTLITTRRNKNEVKELLETYIHGIELDPAEYEKCIARLDKVAAIDGIKGVKWDIKNCDALSCHDYDGKMDFVVANPPYIRTHDLECDLTGYSFTEDGMKDIYLAFYELGFRMMNETGKMCYITPSSWFLSTAGKNMRSYIAENQNLMYIEDYGHTQLFENATTYVAITLFNREKNESVKYVEMEETEDKDGYWKSVPVTVPYQDMIIDGKFYFGTQKQLGQMREIIECGKNIKKENKAFEVKNGFATLADDVFITENTLKIQAPEWDTPKREHLIHAYKSSTGKMAFCIYPYKNGKLVNEETMKKNSPEEYKWLEGHREKLEARATTEPWYAFGRTQAINDVDTQKFPIRSLVRNVDDVKLVEAGRGVGVYGGLYILPKHKIGAGVKADLLEILKTQDFINYVKMLKKYKSGGYYTFSSKELENYLNWKYGKKED